MFKVTFYHKITGARWSQGNVKGTRDEAIAQGRVFCPQSKKREVFSIDNNSFLAE